MDERRRHPRLAAARFTVRLPDGDDLRARFVKDLSEGGLMISTRDVHPIDTEIRIELVPPDDAGAIALSGRVARIAIDQSSGESVPVGMGVRLVDLSDESAAQLARLIAQHRQPLAPDADGEPLDDPEAARRRVEALHNHLGALRARIEALRGELEAYRVDDRSSSTLVDRLWSEKHALQAESDEEKQLRLRLADLNDENANLRQEIERRMEARRDEREQLEAAVAAARKTADELDRQHLEAVEASQRQLGELENRVLELTRELDAERKQTADAETSARREVELERDRAREAEKRMAELLAQTENSTDGAHARWQQLRDELADEYGTIEQLRGRALELNSELSRAKSSYRRLRSKRRDMDRILALSVPDEAQAARREVDVDDTDLSAIDSLLQERPDGDEAQVEIRLDGEAPLAGMFEARTEPAIQEASPIDAPGPATEPEPETEEAGAEERACAPAAKREPAEPDELERDAEPQAETDQGATAGALEGIRAPTRPEVSLEAPCLAMELPQQAVPIMEKKQAPEAAPSLDRGETAAGVQQQPSVAAPGWQPSLWVLLLLVVAILAGGLGFIQLAAPYRLPWNSPAPPTEVAVPLPVPAEPMPVEAAALHELAATPIDAPDKETDADEPEVEAASDKEMDAGEPEVEAAPDRETDAGEPEVEAAPDKETDAGKPEVKAAPEAVAAADTSAQRKRLINGAMVAMRKGRFRAAIAPLTTALEMQEDDSVRVHLGQASYALQRMGDARAHLERAVTLNPRNARAWRLLGDTHAFLERNQAAKAAYRRFLKLVPTGARAEEVRWALQALEAIEKAEK